MANESRHQEAIAADSEQEGIEQVPTGDTNQMSELLPEVLKGLKEYFEMAKWPEELAALTQSLGGCDERVVYKGYARYVNTSVLFDKPLGVILVTNQRFIFITKKKIPLFKNTERIVLPVGFLEKIKGDKYRLGYALKFWVDSKEYLFLLTNLLSFTTHQQVDEVARILVQAKESQNSPG